jgi:hypothetical protein
LKVLDIAMGKLNGFLNKSIYTDDELNEIKVISKSSYEECIVKADPIFNAKQNFSSRNL